MDFLKKHWVIISIVAVLLIALIGFIVLHTFGGGSSSSGSGKATITMWGLFDTNEQMAPSINAFEQAHPGITIVYTEKNVTTYEADLLNAMAAGTGPDIFYIHNDWLPKYLDKMQPAPANAFSLTNYENTFADVASGDFISNQKIYAAPLGIDTLALYYNKDMLGSAGIATPPQTWSDLVTDSQKISKIDSTGYFTKSGVALGTTSNLNRAQDIMYLLMLQAGTVPYTSDYSQSTIDQATNNSSGSSSNSGNQFPGAQALTFDTSFSNVFSNAYDWNTKSNYSTDAFADGQLAMMYGYYYDQATILQKSPNLNFGVAPVPQPTLGQNLVNYSNYWGYGVSKQTKTPNTDWEFIQSITTKSSLEAYYKLDPQPASRKDIISEQVSDPTFGVFASSTLTSKNFYKADAAQVDTIILNMIDDVNLRNKSVSTALSNAAQQITALSSGSQ
jgi:ABC-type glycerol-3-phosphate transport system substrate-binding protein